MGALEVFLAIVLGAIGSLLAAHIYDSAPRWAEKIIARAVRRLPEEMQERMHEEWLGHAENAPSNIGLISVAISIYFGAVTISHLNSRQEKILVRHKNNSVYYAAFVSGFKNGIDNGEKIIDKTIIIILNCIVSSLLVLARFSRRIADFISPK